MNPNGINALIPMNSTNGIIELERPDLSWSWNSTSLQMGEIRSSTNTHTHAHGQVVSEKIKMLRASDTRLQQMPHDGKNFHGL